MATSYEVAIFSAGILLEPTGVFCQNKTLPQEMSD